MSDRIWMATVEAHNATLFLTGFTTEGEAWDVAALFVDALHRARPGQHAEILSVEPDWAARLTGSASARPDPAYHPGSSVQPEEQA